MCIVSFMAAPLWFIFAVAFVAAFLHLRVRSRNRFAGGFMRLILAAGGCFFLLCGLLELSVQRELKPESIPIRVDLLFAMPAAYVLLAVGLIAYLYGLIATRTLSKTEPCPSNAARAAGPAPGTLDPEKANERLAHLLPKHGNEQKN
jgi:hypothetical protein